MSNYVKKVGFGVAAVALPVIAGVAVWQIKEADDANNELLEKGFNYDDKALRHVDPALIGWEEVAQLQTHQDRPTCIAVAADGAVIVGGDGLVSIVGKTPATFAISGKATAIASDASGDIYIAIKDHIEVYSRGGERKAGWQSVSPQSHITSLALTGDTLWLADSGTRVGRVLAYSKAGERLREIAARNDKAGIKGISTPSPHMDLAVTADGNVWVANPGNHQMELYSPTGELLKSFGEAGTSIEQFLGCCNPSDFTLLADGRIVTGEKGVARVKLYADDGHLVSVIAPPTAFTSNRAGVDIAADSAGRVLVLEPGTSVIRLFAEKRQ